MKLITLTTGNLRHEWTFYDILYTQTNSSKPGSLAATERLLTKVHSTVPDLELIGPVQTGKK